MRNAILFSITILGCSLSGFSQFDGPAGTSGSLAIYKDSSVFVGWATSCALDLGPMDVTNPSLGLVTNGDQFSPLGNPDGTTVSLGDSGTVVLNFAADIMDGPGPDFAVFENSFDDQFLELGFVEVSSDGINFIRFNATSNTPFAAQIGPFSAVTEASHLNNLAGKYMADYGTPFDLSELAGNPNLDIMHISHVRIIDVAGAINEPFAQLDQNENPINDPFPTPFPSSGFDLDAVGVIHQQPASISENNVSVSISPNPIQNGEILEIESNKELLSVKIYTVGGALKMSSTASTINAENFTPGLYLVHLYFKDEMSAAKIMVR